MSKPTSSHTPGEGDKSSPSISNMSDPSTSYYPMSKPLPVNIPNNVNDMNTNLSHLNFLPTTLLSISPSFIKALRCYNRGMQYLSLYKSYLPEFQSANVGLSQETINSKIHFLGSNIGERSNNKSSILRSPTPSILLPLHCHDPHLLHLSLLHLLSISLQIL
jgi:hypothetical protein